MTENHSSFDFDPSGHQSGQNPDGIRGPQPETPISDTQKQGPPATETPPKSEKPFQPQPREQILTPSRPTPPPQPKGQEFQPPQPAEIPHDIPQATPSEPTEEGAREALVQQAAKITTSAKAYQIQETRNHLIQGS